MWTNTFHRIVSQLLKTSTRSLTRKHGYSTAGGPPPVATTNQKSIAVYSVSLLESERRIQLHWHLSKPAVSHFPLVWLRDNCQCNTCFHSTSKSRLVNWNLCDITAKAENIEVSPDGRSVSVEWSDGHVSPYSAQWLYERQFSYDAQEQRLKYYRRPKELWGSAVNEPFPRRRFDFASLLECDKSLLAWLLELETRGIALIQGAGSSDEACVRRLADRVAFIRRTHYGEEYSVKVKMDPNNVAYTGGLLQLHTDLPYYEYKPGVNLLHCLVQAQGEGGENHLVDTFRVAKQIRAESAQHYKSLCNVPVNWSDEGQEKGKPFCTLHLAPVICENWQRQVVRVNYSHPQRDSHFSIPIEWVEPWYLAMLHFSELMHRPDNLVTYKMKPGEILSFDNLRICHGRAAYQPAEDVGLERHIVGAYLDWDEICSRIRVLQDATHA